MKISVIIPVYNGEKYVAQCIENILRQTHKEIEIIVINDGSTDRTAEIAERYPVRLVNQQNRGPAATRNHGIELATGDYIHFVDVDDLMTPSFYELMVDAVAQTNADMACCEIVNQANPNLSMCFLHRVVLTDPEDKITLTGTKERGYGPRWLIRRTLLDRHNIRMPEGHRAAEDMPFVIEAVCRAGKIVVVPGARYIYMKRGGSLMNNRDKKAAQRRNDDWRVIQEMCNRLYSEHGIERPFQPAFIEKVEYRLFGCPIVKRKVHFDGYMGWFLAGIRILKRTRVEK